MKEIQVNKQLPIITMNFEEVKLSLQEAMEKYKRIIVTEDGLKDCKATQKSLAGLRNKIDGYRKEVKREMEVPIKEFEEQCKELIGLIADVEKPIKEGIKIYDDKRREEKRNKAQEFIEGCIKAFDLNEKYASRLTVLDKYLTLSSSLKSIREDISNRAKMLQNEQKDEEERREMLRVSIQNAIDIANQSIRTKLTYDDFIKYIEFNWPLDRILKEINDKAYMIREAEKPKEEPKEELKEENKEVGQVPMEAKEEIQKINTEEKEDKFYVDIYVEHNSQNMQALSRFLKEHGYKYKVNKKGKVITNA